MIGGDTFAGAAATTAAVKFEKAVAEAGRGLLAVTIADTSDPTSALTSTYVEPVAPLIGAHLAVTGSQRCHWYVNENGGVPLHTPLLTTVSVSPSFAVPAIVGRVVFTGGRNWTVALSTDTIPTEVAPVAATVSRIVEPASAGVRTYDDEVAPGTARHAPTAHRCH